MNRQTIIYVLVFLAGVFVGAVAFGQSPASELKACLVDAKKLPAASCPSTRYFTLYTIPPERRAKAAQVLGYVLNSLSRVRVITPITADSYVSDTIIRVNFSDYTLEPNEFTEWYGAWEQLGVHDATWHLTTEVLTHGKRVAKTVDGGWVGLAEAQHLKKLTGSQAPLLRADFFIAAATHPPYYYDFAGIPKTLDEFAKSLGIDQKAIAKLRENIGANVNISSITFKDRQVQRLQGVLALYATLDVVRASADRSPLRRPLNAFGTNLVHDAGEYIAVRKNRLFGWALYDVAGKRQDSVPDVIAKDTSDPHGPGIVYAMASCVRCHVENGLRPFKDDEQELLQGAVGYDYATILRLHEFYDEPVLQTNMDFDRKLYAEACKRACGLEPKALSVALGECIREYSYLPMGVAQAARECGVTVDEFKFAMNQTRDPMLIRLCNGGVVLKDQWNPSQAEAQLACAAHIKRDE